MQRKDAIKGKDMPFKKAHYYETLEDAKKDLHGTPEQIERVAKARMDAQELAEKIKKEKDF